MTGFGIRKNDYFWLRVAAMEDPGFLPGAAWNTCRPVYDRMLALGLVERREILIPMRQGGPHRHERAVTTGKGLRAIEARRAHNLTVQAKSESSSTSRAAPVPY